MSVPVTKVEFGFTQSGGAYVYSDVTAYVRSVETNRGRADNYDSFDAGAATIVLDNREREFDPTYLTPTTMRTNFVKNPIPSTSAAVSPQESWSVINRGTGGAGTTTLTADGAFDTVTTAASSIGYSFGVTGSTTAARIPVTAGLTYVASFYATSSVSDTRRMGATFYNAAGTSLGENSGDITVMQAGIETRITGTFTAPATAVSMRIYGGQTTGSIIRPLNSTMYWRHAMVEQTSTLADYFDGSDPDNANITNSWSGTAQASSSTQVIIPSLFGAEVKPQAAVRVTSGNVVIFSGWVDSYAFDYQVAADATVTFNCLDGIARLSVAELDAHTPAAEKTDVRIGNVLSRSEVAWSATARDLDAGVITVGTTPVDEGISAWDYLSEVANSEGGAIFVERAGDVAFKSQREPISDLTVYTYRYNRCVMPSFENATTTVGGATWLTGGRTSTYAKYQTYSATEATFVDPSEPISGGNVVGQRFYDSTSGRWLQNETYTISIWVYQSDVNASNVYLFAGSGILGIDGDMIDIVSTSASLRAPDGWVRLSVQITPSRANKPLCVWTARDSGTLYADALLIEPSIYLGEYFDGTTKPANTSTVTYFSSWTGTTDLSTSTLEIQTAYSGETPYAVYFDDLGTNIPFTGVQLVYGAEFNYNRVVVVNTAGTVTAVDSAAGSASGVRTFTQSNNLSNSLADGTAVANYLLDSYRDPDYRFQILTTELAGLNGDDQVQVLSTDIWDAADITYTPSAVGGALHSIERIVGVAHSITPDRHQVTLQLSSFGSRFILDSTTQGVLDLSRLGSPS
jgi:hypothetical protein